MDPEWLASNDEEARALRQTMAGTKGKPWRVMHRVMQVERPALSGFGEDTRPLPKVAQRSELEQRLSAIESALKQLAADHPLRQPGWSLPEHAAPSEMKHLTAKGVRRHTIAGSTPAVIDASVARHPTRRWTADLRWISPRPRIIRHTDQ